MALSTYANLRTTIRSRNATGLQLGNALRAYFRERYRPAMPLGEGDYLVIDTKGQMKMMTREDYGKLFERKAKRAKRIRKEGFSMLAYDSIEAGRVEAHLDRHAEGLNHEFDADYQEVVDYIDKIVREDRENQYWGEF